ncbi:MAG: GIY-YIG nuclease family protein [Candidatus Omnitrophota bacterium]
MYYAYVLYSLKDKEFYIGYTTNVDKRCEEHASGKTPSTSPRRPFKLIYYEAHLSKKDALRRESYFKSTKGRTALRQILRDSLSEGS